MYVACDAGSDYDALWSGPEELYRREFGPFTSVLLHGPRNCISMTRDQMVVSFTFGPRNWLSVVRHEPPKLYR